METNLGICQAGNGPAFLEVIEDVVTTFKDNITYVEIGVGSGGTLLWVANKLRERVSDFRVIGIDLPDGYSLCNQDIVNGCSNNNIKMRVVKDEVKDVFNPKLWSALANGVTLVLGPAQAILRRHWEGLPPIHIGLIDGCHGVACVTGDFLAIEPYIPVGGYALFHDFGFDSVGEPQPHCGTGDTATACEDLKLTTNRRATWEFIKHSIADKTKNGRDLGVFKRVLYASAVPASDAFRQAIGS